MYARTLVSAFLKPRSQWLPNDVSVTFIDKTDPLDPLKRENMWWETLMTMAPYGLNIEYSVWVLPFDNIYVDTFYSANVLHFTGYWNSLFFRIGVMEDEFVNHYFLNFSFTFLFIVTSIITMVSFIVIIFFVNAPRVVSICHVFFVLAFILTIVVTVVVASMSFICGNATMVCSALLGFVMSMYIYLCMCVCIYLYMYVPMYIRICVCIYVYICIYVWVYMCMYIYIYIYTYFIVIVFVGFYLQLLLSSLWLMLLLFSF